MLHQLIEILVDNAIKYAKKGSTVSVKLTSCFHEFYIKNIGEIIYPKDLPHLFDRFYRIDKSRSEEGFGLGLSIAKGIADKLNIKIGTILLQIVPFNVLFN